MQAVGERSDAFMRRGQVRDLVVEPTFLRRWREVIVLGHVMSREAACYVSSLTPELIRETIMHQCLRRQWVMDDVWCSVDIGLLCVKVGVSL
jgi:hypothetical protein